MEGELEKQSYLFVYLLLKIEVKVNNVIYLRTEVVCGDCCIQYGCGNYLHLLYYAGSIYSTDGVLDPKEDVLSTYGS